MKSILLLLLLVSYVDLMAYHPRHDVALDISIPAGGSQNFTLQLPHLLQENYLHKDILFCIESQLNSIVTVELWDFDGYAISRFIQTEEKLTAVERTTHTSLLFLIKDGLNVTVYTNTSDAQGILSFKRCRQNTFTTHDNNLTTSLTPYKNWDSTIHIPFAINKMQSITQYVDFSTILPRRVLNIHDWSRRAFCMNTTTNGNVKVRIYRCKESKPFVFLLTASKDRQIVRYWNEVISLDEQCPVDEESRPDHLWLDVMSTDHSGIGEVVIYNCQHFWYSGGSHEDDPEIIKITPTLDRTDARHWTFDYVVAPRNRNVYFVPAKHLFDTALVTGTEATLHLSFQHPHSFLISACYNSEKYSINYEDEKMALSKETLLMISEFTNTFDCDEEKLEHGFYVTIEADNYLTLGMAYFYLGDQKGVETPEGILKNDQYTTVAFNLKKGNTIARNVDFPNLIDQGLHNAHVNLHQFFNCTGLVQLYVSRCEFSPKLKLFGPMKSGSAIFDTPTLAFISDFYKQTECLSDFQTYRAVYNSEQYGIYLHVEALEDTIGYVTPYETFTSKIIFHELNEEYRIIEGSKAVHEDFHVFPNHESLTQYSISHLLSRAHVKPQVSFRMYVDSTGPLEFAITNCKEELEREWKSIGTAQNESAIAWYTFDEEGLDLIDGLTNSLNCLKKPSPILYVHVRTQEQIHVRIEFSTVPGIDLNQVSTCSANDALKLQDDELKNKTLILLVEIAMVVVLVLGFTSVLFIYRKAFRAKGMNTNEYVPGSSIELSSDV